MKKHEKPEVTRGTRPQVKVWSLGPLSFLKIGVIWAIDIGPFGVYGVGKHVRFRKVNR